MTEGVGSAPGAERLMTVELFRLDGAVVVVATGEVDELTVERLAAALGAAFDADAGPVVVDLRQVTLLAACGLDALVRAQRRAAREREPLRLVVDSRRPVVRPLEVSGLADVLSLYEDLDEALASRAPDDQDVT